MHSSFVNDDVITDEQATSDPPHLHVNLRIFVGGGGLQPNLATPLGEAHC